MSLLLLAAASTTTAAVLLDFGGSTWDHSGFGGPASSAGWASANGVSGGETTLTDGAATVTVTVEQELFGTAEAYHSILHEGEYSSLTDNPGTDNYLVTAGPDWEFGGAGALNIGSRDDPAPTNNAFENYTKVTISFSTAVTLTDGTFTLGDTDSSNLSKWNDNVGVEVFNGSTPVAYSLDASDANGDFFDIQDNVTVGDKTFSSIVVGNGDPETDARGNDPNAELDVNIDGGFTSIAIYYWNTEPLENEHGIYLRNNPEFAVVPEPGTFALLAGLMSFAWIALKRRGPAVA